MIQDVKNKIKKGALPLHLKSILKKDKPNLIKTKKSNKLFTSKFYLFPHYKNSI